MSFWGTQPEGDEGSRNPSQSTQSPAKKKGIKRMNITKLNTNRNHENKYSHLEEPQLG